MYYKKDTCWLLTITLLILVIVIKQVMVIKGSAQENNLGQYIGENGIYYEYDTISLTTHIVKYEGTESELIIPSSITVNDITYTVTAIGEWVFSGNGLESVTLPGSINTIGNGAFYENQLWSLVIPDSVTTIGEEAFAYNRLTSLELGNAVETLEHSVFSNNKLIHLTIPDTVNSIGKNAFYYNQLTTVNIGRAVNTIREGAFSQNQLTNIIIPNSVTTIEAYAFYHNLLLHSIVIPSSVTSVGNNAFGLGLLETIYTDDGHAETLMQILNSGAMTNIEADFTKISESPLRYHENVSLEHVVAIGDSVSLDVMLGTKYIHDNNAVTWSEHIPQVQWYKDEELILDARESHYSLASIEEEDLGTYFAIVDDERLEDIKIVAADQPVQGIPEKLQLDDNFNLEYNTNQTGTNDHTMYLFIYFSIGFIGLLFIFRLLNIYLARKHR